MRLKFLMAGLMFCLAFHTLFASSRCIAGIVSDDAGSPIEFAYVTLLSAGDSALIDGMVTGVDGRFVLSAASRPAMLYITAMGFDDVRIDNPMDSLGVIRLSPSVYVLDDVVVKAMRPTAKLIKDGVQVAVSGSHLAYAGTALDLLGKMPFVTKVGSEIEVIGKGAPEVYINGRQVRDKTELDRLSSSSIKSVDVVTNPGARYASTVNAVIRIATLSPIGEGWSFSDRTTVGYKHYAYIFEQADFNYRSNGFDVFGSLGYENYRERPRFDNMALQYLQAGAISQYSSGNSFAKHPVYRGKIGLNYNDESHSAGLYYEYSFRPTDGKSASVASRSVDDVFSEILVNGSVVSRHNRQHLLSAYYAGRLGKWRLTSNFDAVWQNNDRQSNENERSSANSDRDFATSNIVDNRLLACNVTASYPVWKVELRVGSEVSDIYRTDLYYGNADYISGNDVKIYETTGAMFVEAGGTFGAVTVDAGLRLEYTDSKYYLSGIRQDDMSRTYHNLAPSVSMTFPMGMVNASLSYTRKTTRPMFEQLSSAVKYQDRYTYESGNPNLRPIYRDYLSLSASWKNLVMELQCSSTKNYFMWQTSQYSGDPGATLLKMQNMPRFASYGAMVNYSPTFFGFWHPSFMASVRIQDFEIIHNNAAIRLDRPIGTFRFDNAFHLPWDMWLNVDFSARTSGNGDNEYIKSRWNCDLGLYKSFANDTWSVKIALNDLFDTWREEFISYDAISFTKVKKLYDTRDLTLTVRCNFNSAQSRYKGSGAANGDKDRL